PRQTPRRQLRCKPLGSRSKCYESWGQRTLFRVNRSTFFVLGLLALAGGLIFLYDSGESSEPAGRRGGLRFEDVAGSDPIGRQHPVAQDASIRSKIQNAEERKASNSNSLSSFIQRAKASSNPEDKLSALSVAAVCTSFPRNPPSLDEIALVGADQNAELAAKIKSSREQLEDICKSGDFEDYLSYVKANRAILTSVTTKVRVTGDGSPGRALNEWEIALLSNPAAYPSGLENWLNKNVQALVPPEIRQNLTLRRHISNELYERLSGDSSGLQNRVRLLNECGTKFVCHPLKLSQADQLAASAIVAEIEGKIRRQLWQSLRQPR
ncbi:MAG TPA: hypothetical protein VGF12_13295, partial [Roseateles sp.]|uniref:hypothetical protein n=1 Tax=Roseateles sp. TaxID=1971397 RepID=UPI002ED93BAC